MHSIRTHIAATAAIVGLVGAVLLLYFGPAQAQSQPQSQTSAREPSGRDIWQEIDQSTLVQSASISAVTMGGVQPTHYRLFTADLAALDAILVSAPQEGVASGMVNAAQAPTVLTLPMPQGGYQRFAIEQYNMLTPDFAAAHPELKTYRGRSLDDPASTVQVSRTPWGFHSMVLTGGQLAYIDPQAQSNTYINYAAQDLPTQFLSDDHIHFAPETANQPTVPVATGDKLHVYRLAVAATSEFSQDAGGQQAAQSKIVSFVNNMNGIYQRDLSVRFVMIDNTNIIYPPNGPDPYSNGNAGAMLNENQANLDQTVGNANYDIGYVLGTNSGGVAALGGLCVAGRKGSGSGSLGVTLHEMAHLLGGGHTFNASSAAANNCSGGNYMAGSAYEPGSGSTILSYSGSICGPQDLQGFKTDTYFHAISIQEMTNYIAGTGSTCGTHDNTGNAPPTVIAGANRIIPARTSFTLLGQASDPNGDPLTYTWEQFDHGQAWTATSLPNTDLGDNPIFRSYPPTGDLFRTFPSPTNQFAAKGESLPTTNRTLHFRLTARDGKGGVNSGDVALQVVNTAGPFVLTAPQAGAIWPPGSQQAVTWNVANTDQPPISCAAVDILASGDGGKTFAPLVQNTPNDGAENVTAPATQATLLIKVACANNVFQAMSPNPGVNICNAVLVDNHEDGAADWTATSSTTRGWQLNTNGGYSGSNYWFTSFFGFGTTTLDSQPKTANFDNLTLTFYQRYFFTPAQTGKVQINVNNTGWQDLKGFAGKSPQYDSGYAAESVALNPLVKKNDTFQVRFQRTTACCDGVSGDPNDGWFLDDVSVCGADTAPPPVPTATPTTAPDATATPTVPPDATPTQTPTATPTVPSVTGPGQAVWTGNGTTDDWNEGANWDIGQPPDGTKDVIIPAGLGKYPTIQSDATLHNLDIAGGATVNMTSGNLTVRGSWGSAATGDAEQICHDLSGGEAGNADPKIFGTQSVSDTIVIPTGGRLTDVDVSLDVAHTWVGDVVATLHHVGSDATVTLVDPTDDNCDADNFAITLDDEADTPVATACISGNNPAFAAARLKPNQPLSVFDNQTYAGAWILTLNDIYPDADNGRLNKWCLNVTANRTVGRFNATGGKVIFAGDFAHILRPSSDSVLHDVQIGDGSNAQQVTLADDLDINGTLEFAAGGQLNEGAFTINLAGDLAEAENGEYNAESGTVILDGGTQMATGDLDFNNLTINPGTTLDMGTYDLAVAGQLVNNGAIRQTKTVNGTAWVYFVDAGGYGGIDLNANGADLGETTVTISSSDTGCTSTPNETIQRCFNIAPTNTTALDADIRFYYTDEEQSKNSCSQMQAYQIDEGSSSLNQLSRVATRCAITPRGLWVNGVTDFITSQIVLGAAVGEPGSRADEPPVAIADTVATNVDTAITIEALQNDFDPEGSGLTLDNVEEPTHGTADLPRAGQIDYTPAEGFTGEDTFDYEISDINGNKSTGSITVVVFAATEFVYLPLISTDHSEQQARASAWRMDK